MGKIAFFVNYMDGKFCSVPENVEFGVIISGETFEDLVKNTEEFLPEQIELMKDFGALVPPEFYGNWNLAWHLSERAEFILD